MVAYVSYKRVDIYMHEEEVPTWASSIMGSVLPPKSSLKIGFADARFQWSALDEERQDTARFTLGPLNINFPIGKLSLITGTNGAGKTALLSALLGGMCVIRSSSSIGLTAGKPGRAILHRRAGLHRQNKS